MVAFPTARAGFAPSGFESSAVSEAVTEYRLSQTSFWMGVLVLCVAGRESIPAFRNRDVSAATSTSRAAPCASRRVPLSAVRALIGRDDLSPEGLPNPETRLHARIRTDRVGKQSRRAPTHTDRPAREIRLTIIAAGETIIALGYLRQTRSTRCSNQARKPAVFSRSKGDEPRVSRRAQRWTKWQVPAVCRVMTS